MDGPSRIPGFYPETPVAQRYNNRNGSGNSPAVVGSIGRVGGPIRRTPAAAISRARAHSTPYARPPPQNTPGSGSRVRRDDDDDDEARIKKSLGEKTVEVIGTLVSGVKDWFSSSKTPRREYVQSVVPRKNTPQRSLTSRMEEGQPDNNESGDMFSPSLAPHYAGHTPWIVKQRKGVLATEPPIFPLPNTNPGHRRQESQGKYNTLPAKRSNALVPLAQNKRTRQNHPREWELSKDRFADQDQASLEWCEKYGIDIVALANGTQKRPPLPSFSDIQHYDSLRNDVAFFERQGIRHVPRTRKSSSLRHATSSYELSRIAQENSAIYNASFVQHSDSSSSKLHAWRELVRLKEARAKAERENIQFERSKQRNGYSPVNSRSVSRASSRVRGTAGDVGDDVWIIPSIRPASSGSITSQSMRMRTSSPIADGSWRSTSQRKSRPRGRDIFGTPEVDELMIDEGIQVGSTLLPPSIEVEPSRRKRPGYFSAREEDLDEIEMDEDYITPARKKQRLSHQGPKFAALWEPSRRENWPLGDTEEKMVEEPRDIDVERERVKNDLKGLESPAFRLPPSARKDSHAMDMEHESPTKGGQGSQEFKFEFTKPPASAAPSFSESNFMPTSVENAQDSAMDSPSSESPTKESPSKTATFMQSILSEPKSAEEDMEDIPSEKAKENGVTESKPSQTESQQSSAPKFEFSLPPTQSSLGGSFVQEPATEDPATGGFQFGKSTTEQNKPAPSPFAFKSGAPTTQPANIVEPPKFTFGIPTEPKKDADVADKPVVTKTAPSFTFSKSTAETADAENPVQTKPAPAFTFGNSAAPASEEQPKPVSAFTFGKSATDSSSAPAHTFGSFGGFGKVDVEKSELTAPATIEAPATNGTAKDDESAVSAPTAASAPTFGAATGFTYGAPTNILPAPSIESPKKESAISPAIQDAIDDSMDITDSPPATRNSSFAGTPSEAPQFEFKFGSSAPTSAPTSAPSAVADATKAPTAGFQFGQVNGDKSTAPQFKFGSTEEKKPEFGATSATSFTPVSTTATAFAPTSNHVFGAAPSTSSLGGFGSAFAKKEEPEKQAAPAGPQFGFQFGAPTPSFTATPSKPAETNPMFGSQTPAPAFGGATGSLFGNTAFPSQSVTSPSVASAAPTFSFNFNAATPTTNTPTFGGGSFSFGAPNAVPNPFGSNVPPPATSPAPFQGISSAPVSPQNQQPPTFPGVQPAFGATPQPNPFQATNTSFQFGQNIPQSPMFTLGSSQMQRSSSDAGPNNASPSGRKFAQPGRRRLNRR